MLLASSYENVGENNLSAPSSSNEQIRVKTLRKLKRKKIKNHDCYEPELYRKAAETQVVCRIYGQNAFVLLLFTWNSQNIFSFFKNTLKNHWRRERVRKGAISKLPESCNQILILHFLYCSVSVLKIILPTQELNPERRSQYYGHLVHLSPALSAPRFTPSFLLPTCLSFCSRALSDSRSVLSLYETQAQSSLVLMSLATALNKWWNKSWWINTFSNGRTLSPVLQSGLEASWGTES